METGTVPDLAMIGDRLAIQDVLAKHSRGVDRADEATLKGCYWPDSTVAAVAPAGSVILAMLPDTGERYLSTPLFAGINEGSDDEWLASL